MIGRGAFNQRITLKAYTNEREPDGSLSKGYSSYAQPWAKVTFVSGREDYEDSMQEVARTQITVLIRYRADVSATDVIEYRGDTYNIKSINPKGRNLRERLFIEAEKKENNQP